MQLHHTPIFFLSHDLSHLPVYACRILLAKQDIHIDADTPVVLNSFMPQANQLRLIVLQSNIR
jgi:hypothetical protein